MERCQGVSVVRLHDVLLEHRDDVSNGRNNDVPSVRLKQVSNEAPNDVSIVRYQDVLLVSNQTSSFSSTKLEGNKKCSLDYKLVNFYYI